MTMAMAKTDKPFEATPKMQRPIKYKEQVTSSPKRELTSPSKTERNQSSEHRPKNLSKASLIKHQMVYGGNGFNLKQDLVASSSNPSSIQTDLDIALNGLTFQADHPSHQIVNHEHFHVINFENVQKSVSKHTRTGTFKIINQDLGKISEQIDE